MWYELFVGWRYLFRRQRLVSGWIAFILFTVLCFVGVSIFQVPAFKTISILMALVGGLGSLASLLLIFFSTFTAISMLGLALGVSILIWVLSVTSGFQEEFRNKVLGVNAHVLILKYGIDFAEYPQVMKATEALPHVLAASPFVFNEMMISKGNRLSGVLI